MAILLGTVVLLHRRTHDSDGDGDRGLHHCAAYNVSY
jgi:hypothetical protein